MPTRRSVLLGGLAALTASALPLRLAYANEGCKRLVVVLAYGGWDPTWVFDPKPDAPIVHTTTGDWSTHGALSTWSTAQTPAVDAFFRAHHAKTAILNGVAVNSLVHEECASRVLAGASGRADLPSRAAKALGTDLPLPYLVLGNQARTTGHDAIAGQVGLTNQLVGLVRPDAALPAVDGYSSSRGFVVEPRERTAVHTYLRARQAQLTALHRSDADQRLLADYATSLDHAERIRAHALLQEPGFEVLEDPMQVAHRALAAGFSQTALIEDSQFWDTHAYNTLQGGMFEDLFTRLKRLVDGLEADGSLDDTLVMVLSEMGRSPELNSDAGKDHWPFTSMLLIGGGVQSRTVGATGDRMEALAIDRSSGAAVESGTPLQAHDVLATAATLLDLDSDRLYPDAEVIRALV